MSWVLDYLKLAAHYEKLHNKDPNSAARWDLAARDARSNAAFALRGLKDEIQ